MSGLQHECLLHFQNLFPGVHHASSQEHQARQRLLQHVTPIIHMTDAARFELPFTETELEEALHHLGKSKSPGWDGLSVEFYLAFWEDLKDVLLQMINMAWQEGCLPSSWKHGIVQLVPKKSLCQHMFD